MRGKPAVFLDRDGVLNRKPPAHEYVESAATLEVEPHAAEAVGTLRDAGYTPIVVSNQRGVALGRVSEETLTEIEHVLVASGIQIEAFYYCRHDLPDRCACRKPCPGLLIQAAADHGLSLDESVMIGDEETDVEAGRAAGCRTIRLAAGDQATGADEIAADLEAAAAIVAARWSRPRSATAS